MKKLKIPVTVFGVLMALYSCTGTKKINVISGSGKKEIYKLVWADEFNEDGVPDTSNWQYEKGFV